MTSKWGTFSEPGYLHPGHMYRKGYKWVTVQVLLLPTCWMRQSETFLRALGISLQLHCCPPWLQGASQQAHWCEL